MEARQSHTGSGDNVSIHASGGGDAFGGDKVMGDKHEHHYHPEPIKAPPGKEYRLPSRNIAFTGREAALTAIAAGFEAQAATGVIRQAGSGMGGVGKTTLAVEYAYRYAERYDLLAFLDAGSSDVLDNSLLGLAEHLHLSGEDAEAKRNELRHWLSGHSLWLLIMDNADDAKAMQAVQAFIPNLASGHVLITTRMANPAGIPQTNIRSVGEFTREEAIAFLQKKTVADATDEVWCQGAAELAEELGDLPLALEQAAALIIQSGLSLVEYLDAYRQEKLDLLKEGAKYALLDKPELKQVAVTWNMNLKAVAEQKPILKELLNLSAMMAPETIPFEWITQGLAVTEPEVFGAYATAGAVKRMLTPLRDYSLVQGDGEKGFQLHRLVQAVIQHPLPEEEKAACHLRCMQAVIRTIPKRDYAHTWPRLLYAQVVFLVKGPWNPQCETVELLCNLAGYYAKNILGDIQTAEPLFKKSLWIREGRLGESHPDTAQSYNNLASLYQDQGRYMEAEPMFKKALVIYEAQFGECHPYTAGSYNNLGELYQDQGDYARAEPLLKKALKINESVFGEHHPCTASGYNNLGWLYKDQGDYARAEPLLVKALEMCEAMFGEPHPYTARSYNNLGALYQVQGDYACAEPLLKKALEVREALFGERHPDTASSYNNLGWLYLYQDQGDYARAEPLLKKALFGKRHPDTALSYNNLGVLYQIQGNYVQAEPLFEKALEINESVFGVGHSATRMVLENLVALYQTMGLDESAIRNRIQALFEKLVSDDREGQ